MFSDDLPYLIAEPPEHIMDDIVNWGYENIPNSLLYDEQGYGRELYVHLTFLTNVDVRRNTMLNETLAMQSSVNGTLGKVMTFTQNSKFDVVCLEIVNGEVLELHRRLHNSIVYEQIYPTFIPHITIAYVKKSHGEKYRGNTYFEGNSFTIDDLVVSHNRGKSQERVRLKK